MNTGVFVCIRLCGTGEPGVQKAVPVRPESFQPGIPLSKLRLRMPRRSILPLLVALAVLAAGCGGGGATGKVAEKVIHDDWLGAQLDSGVHWSGHPELDGSKLGSVSCAPRPDSHRRLACTVHAILKNGRSLTLRVRVTFNSTGALDEWTFAD